MNILVTGANGFIGKNLTAELANQSLGEVLPVTRATDRETLEEYCQKADFVFHLAGVNRPKEEAEFTVGNVDFTGELLGLLKKHGNNCPVMLSSSTQAERDNPYGQSKQAGEALVFQHGKETGAEVFVYRFPNVFGKWCRPNYNSAIATFCHNIARDLPIQVNDPTVQLQLVHIDDVVQELIHALAGKANRDGAYCSVPVVHSETLGNIVALLQSFRGSRSDRMVPDQGDPFSRKLYSTYLSYLPEDQFSYPLKMNTDARGSFTEFLKSPERGQVSVNVSKPGITKGNHWHHTKNEKFLVVSGQGVIRFRKVGSEEVVDYPVSGDKLEVVDIPPGFTHNIENVGQTDLVTIMWANELFDPERADTWYLEV